MELSCPYCKKTFSYEEWKNYNKEYFEILFKKELQSMSSELERKYKMERDKSDDLLKKIQSENKALISQINTYEKFKEREVELIKKDLELVMKEKESKIRRQEKERSLLEIQIKERELASLLKKREEEIKKQYENKKKEAEIIASSENKELKEKLARRDKEVELLNEKISNIVREQKARRQSQELQGEEAEIKVKKEIEDSFRTDLIEDIKKGQKGGDLILTVRERGEKCGSILIEVKNTKSFKNDWIEKIGDDLLINKCDLGLIISKTVPKDVVNGPTTCLQHSDNIFSCSFSEGITVLALLRLVIIDAYKVRRKDENIDSAKDLLYQKINSPEFQNRLHKIVVHFNKMREAIDKQEQSQIKYLHQQRSNITMLISEMIKIRESVNTTLIGVGDKIEKSIIKVNGEGDKSWKKLTEND